MLYLMLAIFFSVSVSVLLKIAQKYHIHIEQSIAINYLITTALSYTVLKPNLQDFTLHTLLTQYPQTPLFIALGLLLPSVFIIMSKSVEWAGIVRSDTAQRLSLFLPIATTFLIFGETLTPRKAMGLFLAFLSLICLMTRNEQNKTKQPYTASLYLILVWLGYGVIDILFKELSKIGTSFPSTLLITFFISGCVMFLYLGVKQTPWKLKNIAVGAFLGLLNFMNILFYIKAHQSISDSPSLVFAGMNIGVICLGTWVGSLLFKEKLKKIHWIGISIGLAAVLYLLY